MSSIVWIWVGLSSLIMLLIWVAFRWGKTSSQKESLDDTIKIKDKQLRIRKPTGSRLIKRMRKGGF